MREERTSGQTITIASDPMATEVLTDIKMVGSVNASRPKVGHRS
jgi:hypothetical protein